MILFSEEFSSGVSFMDNSTKRFISELNKLCDAMKSGEGRQYVIFALDFLKDYCETHLEFENKVMMQYEFYDHSNHSKIHSDFRSEVLEFIKKYDQSGADHGMPLAVQRMMSGWLLHHVSKQDKVFGDFIALKLQSKAK
jgi:hemerythrin